MASSLTFRLRALFESTGFREAQRGFADVLGVVGRLAVAAAGLVFRFRTLGLVLGGVAVVQAGRLAINLARSGEAAVRAETAFVRLQTQLDLLGEGSQENIRQVTRFAQAAESSTRFAATEIQESVAIAIRRTGDLERALRQVSVAQDIAAATGRSLRNVTLLLNIAQAGNTRLIRQITNLRRADIQAAQRQGRLIELLADRFGGAAQREAGTFAARLEILTNAQERFRREIGEIFLPLRQFVLGIRIGLTQSVNEAISVFKSLTGAGGGLAGILQRNATFTDRFAEAFARVGSAGAAFAIALQQARQDTEEFQQSVSGAAGAFTFNFERQLEIATLRLGRTRDERRQIGRDIARANEIIRLVETRLLSGLRAEQVEFVQQFQFGRRAIDAALRTQVSEEEENQRRLFRLRQNRIKQSAELRQQADLGPAGVLQQQLLDLPSTVSDSLQQLGAIAPQVSQIVIDAFRNIGSAAQEARTQGIVGLAAAFAEQGDSILEIARNISQTVAQIVETQVRPNFQVNVSLVTPAEQVRQAVITALQQAGILGFQARLQNEIAQSARESQSNASA